MPFWWPLGSKMQTSWPLNRIWKPTFVEMARRQKTLIFQIEFNGFWGFGKQFSVAPQIKKRLHYKMTSRFNASTQGRFCYENRISANPKRRQEAKEALRCPQPSRQEPSQNGPTWAPDASKMPPKTPKTRPRRPPRGAPDVKIPQKASKRRSAPF